MVKDNYNRKRKTNNENKNSRYEKYEIYFRDNILKINSLDADKYDEFIEQVKEYVNLLKRGLTTSQIRKVYSELMHSNEIIEVKKLRPKLAYIIGRSQSNSYNDAVKSLLELLDYGIKSLQSEEEIESIKEFMETIVAYRKYVGNDK